jgi:transposase
VTQLFYEFRLGDAVPEDHLVRKIDTALDLSWLRSELAPHYSSAGRPSIDPELMVRMLVVGYVFAIRSERRICREVQVNLAYRWFCKLGIEDAVPDHSAVSRARNERFREGDVFRQVFERVVETCIAAGLVGGEGFAVDASLIQADANKQRSIAGQDWRRDCDPARSSRAAKEYLATLDDASWGAASDVVPKFISPSDPAAQWTGAHKRPAFFAYSDNYLIDVKFGVIVDVEGPMLASSASQIRTAPSRWSGSTARRPPQVAPHHILHPQDARSQAEALVKNPSKRFEYGENRLGRGEQCPQYRIGRCSHRHGRIESSSRPFGL